MKNKNIIVIEKLSIPKIDFFFFFWKSISLLEKTEGYISTAIFAGGSSNQTRSSIKESANFANWWATILQFLETCLTWQFFFSMMLPISEMIHSISFLLDKTPIIKCTTFTESDSTVKGDKPESIAAWCHVEQLQPLQTRCRREKISCELSQP